MYPSYPLELPLQELLGILFLKTTLYMTLVDVDSSWTSWFFLPSKDLSKLVSVAPKVKPHRI